MQMTCSFSYNLGKTVDLLVLSMTAALLLSRSLTLELSDLPAQCHVEKNHHFLFDINHSDQKES